MREGILLAGADDRRRVAFEIRALAEALDFAPYLHRYDRALLERAKRGQLGA